MRNAYGKESSIFRHNRGLSGLESNVRRSIFYRKSNLNELVAQVEKTGLALQRLSGYDILKRENNDGFDLRYAKRNI